ncbi:PAS domain S-box protein [Xanthocytophaga flava]|uniref:PAS domain S-box protein n=1 Tax=Xanthocytophaga flava TaxID=3048013 RepID=UPI0028D42E6D|nr:PAS domain S-box protein [Xanthocytophaga flavus]MDJ1466735.1 PAS domain S-box protein [Xanthocytophaga flavus]
MRAPLVSPVSVEIANAIFEQAADGIFVSDPNFHYIHANPVGCQMFGYTLEELRTMSVMDILAPEELQKEPLHKEELETGGVVSTKRHIRHKDGRFIPVEINSRKLQDGNLVAFVRIIKRKDTQAQLKVRLQQQSAVTELTQLALQGTDTGRLFEYAIFLTTHLLSMEFAQIQEWDADRKRLLFRVGTGWPETCIHADEVADEDNYRSQAIYALCSNTAVIANDWHSERRFEVSPFLNEYHIVSGISVVITSTSEPFGVLSLYSKHYYNFDEDDLHFVQAMANVLAMAIERKKVEEVLREERDRFEKLVATVPGVVLAFREKPDGSICFPYASPGIEDIYGLKADSLANDGSLAGERWHTEDRAQILEKIALSKQHMARWHDEFRVVNPQKGELWVEGWSMPKRDLDGGVTWYGVLTDITNRKKAEAELIESAHLYRSVFENAAIGIARVALDGKWLDINQKLLAIVGYSREELLQKTFQDITHPEDIDTDLQLLQQTLDGEIEGYTMQKRYFHKNNFIVWVRLTVSLQRDETGEPLYFISVIEDITEQKRVEDALLQSENNLKQIIENLSEGLIISDRDGNLLHWNPVALQMHGFETMDECRGAVKDFTSIYELSYLDGDVIPVEQWPISRLLRNEKVKNQEIQIRHLKKDWVRVFSYGGGSFSDLYGNTIYFVSIGDITEKTHNAQAILKLNRELHLNERRFRSMIEYSSDFIAVLNANQEITYRSPSWQRIFEWDTKGGRSPRFNLLHPEDQPHVQKLIQQISRIPGASSEVSIRVIDKKGNYHFMDGNVTNLLTDEAVRGLVINLRDISAKKIAEEKVKASEEQFRALIENSNDIFIVSTRDTISFVSRSIKHVLGYTPEEYMTLSPEYLVHPDDQPLRWNELNYPGDTIELLFRKRHKDGTWRWMEGIAMNLEHIQGVNGVLFTLRDITERKESEKKLVQSEKIYKTIASTIPGSIICLFDQEGRYLLVEGDLLNEFGYNRESLIGRKAKDLLDEDVVNALDVNLKRVFGGEVFTTENRSAGTDIITRYVPIKDETDKVTLAMLVSIDVTDIKEAQRQIYQLNQELEKRVEERTSQLVAANKELDSFNYTVAHDLRAPLRAINGYSSILAEDYASILGAEGKRFCTIITNESRRMGRLIDDLLAFARLNRSQMELFPVDLNDMVREVFLSLTTESQRDRIQFQVEELPPMQGDISLMRQVWQNLIENAVKFSSKRDVAQIHIGYYKEADGPIYFIRDNGVGFDMKYIDKLFGVFQRFHKASEFEGTGVGMAIVQRIIQRHGGRIWAESKVNEGTTFYFSFTQ